MHTIIRGFKVILPYIAITTALLASAGTMAFLVTMNFVGFASCLLIFLVALSYFVGVLNE